MINRLSEMKSENKRMFKLGITGGIGSGKTSAGRVFEVLGIPVFSADREAGNLVSNNADIRSGINAIAGKNLYSSGNLDRTQLADLIFKDKVLLGKVNKLIHPAVFRKFLQWVDDQTADYVVMEAAILFESGGSKYVDRTVTIIAPVEERIERVIERSKLTKEQIMERMDNQMPDEERIKLSDYIIDNSENELIIPAILKIHSEILKTVKNQNL